ncbi:trehalose-phosphate phosphatase-like protein, partial [Trifolium pratense]
MKSILPANQTDDENEESIWSSYDSWLEKYPSALENFEKVMNIGKEKKIVVFLDYDGTLSQIVDDPDKAYMTDA